MSDDDIKQAWRSQPVALPQRTPEELRSAADAFARKIARRNRYEYLAGGASILVFCYYLWLFPYWVTRLGSALVVAGMLIVLWQLHRRAGVAALPGELGATSVQFMRTQLARQRDALRSVWRWYLGPLVPGMLVFLWGRSGGSPGSAALLIGLAIAAVFVAIGWLNRLAAAQLQQEIDALDASAGSPTDPA